VGTLLVAVLAIWGDLIKSHITGPKLVISLHDPQGEPTKMNDGKKARHYHLKVSNKRRWAPAKNVRVVLTNVIKPAADGSYPSESLSGPLQLQWQFSQTHQQYSFIGPDDICDLGYIKEGDKFYLLPYIWPLNFDGALEAKQKMRVDVIAIADNTESNVLHLAMEWDGTWSNDTLQMKKKLVIKEVKQRKSYKTRKKSKRFLFN
jgi:hypothetical protein